MKIPLLVVLFLMALPVAQATVYNNRAAFEAAIEIIYNEDFESLGTAVATHGGSLSLPSRLVVDTSNDSELFSVPVGYTGPKGELPNTSIILGDRKRLDPDRNGGGLGLDLGLHVQAIGFNFYSNLDLSNPNRSADFQFDIFSSELEQQGDPDKGLVGQFGSALSTRGDPLFPAAGFFGFVNDGNPLDVFDINDPNGGVQNGIITLVRQPNASFDQVFVSNFDGSGRYEFVDDVIVGDIAAPVPLPASGLLLLAGITGLFAYGKSIGRINARSPSFRNG